MIGPGSDKTESGWWCGLVVANISHVLTPRNIVIPQLLTSTGKSEICLFTMRKKVNGRVFWQKITLGSYLLLSWGIFFAYNFFLWQLSVPCLLIIFFSGNFFSRLIFLLGQLSGACLFIKKIHRKFFMLRQFISPGQLSGACLFINDPRDKKRLFFPITVYSRNEKNITLKAITMKTFHWEDSDSDLIFPECLLSNLFFRNCVSEKLFQTKFDEILIWSGSCGIQKSDWQQDNFCK